MPLSSPPGTPIRSINAGLKRENYGYVQGQFILTDEVLAFRPAPFFPTEHFTIPKDHLIDVKTIRTESSEKGPTMFLDVIYKDDQNQIYHREIGCWGNGPAMIDNIKVWIGRPITATAPFTVRLRPIPPRETWVRFCPSCGIKLDYGISVCKVCGTPIQWITPNHGPHKLT